MVGICIMVMVLCISMHLFGRTFGDIDTPSI